MVVARRHTYSYRSFSEIPPETNHNNNYYLVNNIDEMCIYILTPQISLHAGQIMAPLCSQPLLIILIEIS